MKIKLRKANDFWGLIHPSEPSNTPLIMLNHLTPEKVIDKKDLPEWAISVIEKSKDYGIILVEDDEEKKEVITGIVVESKPEKPVKKRSPRKTIKA